MGEGENKGPLADLVDVRELDQTTRQQIDSATAGRSWNALTARVVSLDDATKSKPTSLLLSSA